MPRQAWRVLREQTKQFIDENPTSLVINRVSKASDGAGGTTVTTTSLAPQVVRIIDRFSAVQTERRTTFGEVTSPDINVLFEWDGDVRIGDTFAYKGFTMEVTWVLDNGYRRTAEVSRRP